MVNDRLYWCLLNTNMKGHFKLSFILPWGNVVQHKTASILSLLIAINFSGPGIVAQVKSISTIGFTMKLQKLLEQFCSNFDS